MTTPPNVPMSKPSWNLEQPIPSRSNPTNHRRRASTTTAPFLRLRQHRPYLGHSSATSRQHTILHAVQIAAMDRRYKTAGDKAEYDARGEVVFAKALAELEVLVEHCAEREGDGLVRLVCCT